MCTYWLPRHANVSKFHIIFLYLLNHSRSKPWSFLVVVGMQLNEQSYKFL